MDLRNFIHKLRKHKKGKDVSRQLFLLKEPSWSPSLLIDSNLTHIQPKGSTNSFSAITLNEFAATRPDECSFGVGDILNVLSASGDWWLAINLRTKQEGLIPHNYVTSDMSLSNVLEAWFNVDRMGAERKLLMPGVLPGTYILRSCRSKHYS